jgi:hypothetical protein
MAAHVKTGTMASPKLYLRSYLDHLGLSLCMYFDIGIGNLILKMT